MKTIVKMKNFIYDKEKDVYVCPRCKGRGIYFFEGTSQYECPCKECMGLCHVDWIERIRGVPVYYDIKRPLTPPQRTNL